MREVSIYVMLFKLVSKCRIGHVELLRCLSPVPPGFFQGFEEYILLAVAAGGSERGLSPGELGREVEVFGLDQAGPAEDGGALDDVSQLAGIAGVGVIQNLLLGLGGETLDFKALAGRER
jgi:hypothetical protein